jgi:hypothetical protein
MQRDGRWINPLTLDNKPAEPISEEQLPAFLAWRDELRTALKEGRSPFVPELPSGDLLAENEDPDPFHASALGK